MKKKVLSWIKDSLQVGRSQFSCLVTKEKKEQSNSESSFVLIREWLQSNNWKRIPEMLEWIQNSFQSEETREIVAGNLLKSR